MTLPLLLDRVGVSRHDREMWFSHCRIISNQLQVSDIDDFGCIGRCWEARLREALPQIEVVFVPARQAVSR